MGNIYIYIFLGDCARYFWNLGREVLGGNGMKKEESFAPCSIQSLFPMSLGTAFFSLCCPLKEIPSLGPKA